MGDDEIGLISYFICEFARGLRWFIRLHLHERIRPSSYASLFCL